MKTALTQLLERIEATINNDTVNDIGIGQAIGLKLVKASIENEWLELEKQQIIDASVQANLRYDTGANEPVVLRYCNDAEQYYNRTFGINTK